MAREGIERLVNRQVRAWEEERRARDAGAPAEPLPCITVSREFGTLGAKVAEVVARTLRVRAFAPIEARVRNVIEGRGLTEADARALIAETDRQRGEYHLKYFNKNWSTSEHYDLLINTATYPIDTAARLVIEAYTLRFGRPGEARRS